MELCYNKNLTSRNRTTTKKKLLHGRKNYVRGTNTYRVPRTKMFLTKRYLQSCGTEGRGQGRWKCKQEVLPELNTWRTSQIRTKIAPIHYDPCSTMLVSRKTFRMLDQVAQPKKKYRANFQLHLHFKRRIYLDERRERGN